ncbi:unnamed protein product [Adineta ricciae]|uniref:Uncharacterized protein n=1 Tax=Adineta ricciae TaxID=249248 RepID=A0A815LFK8_ADIRI|nr:unnamed protein product [Adineta ricciae]
MLLHIRPQPHSLVLSNIMIFYLGGYVPSGEVTWETHWPWFVIILVLLIVLGAIYCLAFKEKYTNLIARNRRITAVDDIN